MSRPSLVFVENLRHLMQRRGLTQRDLERKSAGKISQASLSYILSGKSEPNLLTVDLLAGLLGTTAWKMLKPRKESP
jgi:transcriptional regulator with XRE-family HTH domain